MAGSAPKGGVVRTTPSSGGMARSTFHRMYYACSRRAPWSTSGWNRTGRRGSRRRGTLRSEVGVGKTLSVDRVTVAYDRTVVLRDISAMAEPGRMLAVTGPSGAGKTTLLWAMAGLVKPVNGSVT